MSKFSRPTNCLYPQVYHIFKAKNKTGNKVIEYRIQDLPEDKFENALELLVTDFATEETLCVAKNITHSPMAFNEICYFWHEIFKQKLSIGCFTDDNELVAVAAMTVEIKGAAMNHFAMQVNLIAF
jgi:hypothetical protein